MKAIIRFFLISILCISTVYAEDKVSPLSVAGATTVTPEKAKELFDKGVLFVDVRRESEYEAGRIPGAVNLELEKVFKKESLMKQAKPDEPVVMYCNGPKCMRSSEASEKAVSWGFTKVYYLREGFPAWQSAGYPVE